MGDSLIAPLRGSTSLYSYLKDDMVLLMKEHYNYFVTRTDAFDNLYFKLDEKTAALKDDCIEYTIYHPDKPLCHYPYWYIEAFDNGLISEDETGSFIFYDGVAMDTGGVMLCNHLGQLRYVEWTNFVRYYEPIGGDL